jgi:PAS domain S-box-containing protein
MAQMHSLLKRQLKRHFGDDAETPPQWRAFIDSVDAAYRGFDEDRRMLEHSLDLSSQELMDANAEMRAVFQAIPDVVLRLNHAGTILDIKAGAPADLMLERQDLIGKRIQATPLKAVGLQFSAALDQVIAHNAPVSIEYSAVLRGQESHYEARLAPLPERQTAVIIRNVTERKQSLRLLGCAVEQSTEAIVITDAKIEWPGAHVLFVNPAFIRMTGYSAAEVLGQTPHILQGPKSDRAALRRLRETLRAGEPCAGESIAYRKDGTDFHLEWQVVPLRDSSGTVTHFLGVQRDITERIRTESALRESNEKFRQMAENISDVFWIRSPDMREVHYLSPAFERIWGRPTADFLNNPAQWSEAIVPQDRERVVATFRTLMAQAPSISIEYRIMRPGGELRWIHARGFQVRDAQDQLIRLTGIVTDITERKQAEEALRESEEHFRFLYDLTEATRELDDPDEVTRVMARMLGEQLRASRCGYGEFGADGDEFTVRQEYIADAASAHARARKAGTYRISRFGPRAAAALAGGRTLVIGDIDQELLPREGSATFSAIEIRAIIACPLIRDGAARALIVVHQDRPREWTRQEVAIVREVVERCWAAVERRTAQKALRLSESRSRSIIESAQDAFASIDAQGRIRDWNRRAESMFGCPRAEAIGRLLHETIIPPRNREAHWRVMRKLQASGTAAVLNKLIEFTALRSDGTEFPAEMITWSLSTGSETTYQAFVRDITERKRAQAELENVHRQLVDSSRRAGMAEIATNVLHNVGNVLNSVNVSAAIVANTLRNSRSRGLTQAVRLLDEHSAGLGAYLSADAKGKLLPGYLSGAVAALAEEQRGMVDELAHLTHSIDHIKGVVATQQSYAGGGTLVEAVQICDLAEDALRMNADLLARGRVSVVKHFARIAVMRLDRARVLQILVNLISNAAQAMDAVANPCPHLTLRVERAADVLRISVEDEGEGIPAQNLTLVFSHGFTTRKAGHGFGLHSCALAARQMGGTLTAHSDGPGRGAVFTLEFPIAGVSQSAQPGAARADGMHAGLSQDEALQDSGHCT